MTTKAGQRARVAALRCRMVRSCAPEIATARSTTENHSAVRRHRPAVRAGGHESREEGMGDITDTDSTT